MQWHSRPDGMDQAVVFQPGYNCTNMTMKGHGVHGMEIIWYLRGPRGVVSVVFGTDWIPGILGPGHGRMPAGFPPAEIPQFPNGYGVSYCAHVPQYEGQEPASDDCPVIGGTCYSDTSYIASDPIAEAFTEKGEPAVWAALQERYADLKGADHG